MNNKPPKSSITKRENLIVSIGCGIVLAGLVLAFIIKATN